MAPKKKSAGKTQGEIVDLESGTLIRDSFFIDLNKGASSGPGGNVLVVPEYSPGMFLKSPQVAVYGRRRKPLSQLPSNKQCDNTNIDCPVTYLSSGEDLPSTPDISDKGGHRRALKGPRFPFFGRSLSVSGRRSSVVRLKYDLFEGETDFNEPDSPWIPQSAEKRELNDSRNENDSSKKGSKTRAPSTLPIPRDYIAKQQAVFADVDAYELEEESPSKQDDSQTETYSISRNYEYDDEDYYTPELTDEQLSKAAALFGDMSLSGPEFKGQSAEASSGTEAGGDSENEMPRNDTSCHEVIGREIGEGDIGDVREGGEGMGVGSKRETSPSAWRCEDLDTKETEGERRTEESGGSEGSTVPAVALGTTIQKDVADVDSSERGLKVLSMDLEADAFEPASKRLSRQHAPKLMCSPVVEEEEGGEESASGKPRASSLAAADRKGEMELLPLLERMLMECHQPQVVSLREAIKEFCNIKGVGKLGEGTYGEAFSGADLCFKIVPMDANMLVNGEPQKSMEEMLNETVLTNALTTLREGGAQNRTTSFIQTKGVRVCRGAYEAELIEAWEEWDAENTSENEHPNCFQKDQLYTVFVFANGGQDLEHCVLNNYDEARSVLLQAVVALAAAEQSCGFEHRDLHWGNVLVASTEEEVMHCRLTGQDLSINTCGVSVSIIDFTLSRLDAGKRVLFYDMSDPSFFEGPSGIVQFDTYRRMRKATKGNWEKRCPKTNALWIHYLADVILNQKYYPVASKEKTALRSFRKRALLYNSAVATVDDKFFEDLFA